MSNRYIRYLLGIIILILLVVNFFLSLIPNVYVSYASLGLSGFILILLAILLLLLFNIDTNLDIYKDLSTEKYLDVFIGKWDKPNRVITLVFSYFRISQLNYFTNDNLDIYTRDGNILVPSESIYPTIEFLVDRVLAYKGPRPRNIYENTNNVFVLPNITFGSTLSYSKTLKNIIENNEELYTSNLHGSLIDFIMTHFDKNNFIKNLRKEINNLQKFDFNQTILTFKTKPLSDTKEINNIMSNILFNKKNIIGGTTNSISNYLIGITDDGIVDVGIRIKNNSDEFLDSIKILKSKIPKNYAIVYILNYIHDHYC